MVQHPAAMEGKPRPEKGRAHRGREETWAERGLTEAGEDVDGGYGQYHRVEYFGTRMGGP
eukprot:12783922-Heterocapsa_arctica.AAC.1